MSNKIIWTFFFILWGILFVFLFAGGIYFVFYKEKDTSIASSPKIKLPDSVPVKAETPKPDSIPVPAEQNISPPTQKNYTLPSASQVFAENKKLLMNYWSDSAASEELFFYRSGANAYKKGNYWECIRDWTFSKIANEKIPTIETLLSQAKECQKWKKIADKFFSQKKFVEAHSFYQKITATNPVDKFHRNREIQCEMFLPQNLILVKGGTFQMGDSVNLPVHAVILDEFYLGKYEVTNEQFAAFLNEYGHNKVKNGEDADKSMVYDSDETVSKWGVRWTGEYWEAQKGFEKHPAVYVTWFGANEFCQFYGLSLPTEAQWEYAAKFGNKKFAGSDNIDEVAWYNLNSQNNKNSNNTDFGTHKIGLKKPNELNLFDLSGNVWEWCLDWYADYSKEIQKNPVVVRSGERTTKIVRGGSWDYDAERMLVTSRYSIPPREHHSNVGFRICKNKKN